MKAARAVEWRSALPGRSAARFLFSSHRGRAHVIPVAAADVPHSVRGALDTKRYGACRTSHLVGDSLRVHTAPVAHLIRGDSLRVYEVPAVKACRSREHADGQEQPTDYRQCRLIRIKSRVVSKNQNIGGCQLRRVAERLPHRTRSCHMMLRICRSF